MLVLGIFRFQLSEKENSKMGIIKLITKQAGIMIPTTTSISLGTVDCTTGYLQNIENKKQKQTNLIVSSSQ